MANRLKELREKAGLTQVELGDRVNTSGQQIGHLESGKRNLNTEWMRKLGRALGVPLSAFLDQSEDAEAPPSDDVVLSDSPVPLPQDMPKDLPVLGTAAGAFSEQDGAQQMDGGVVEYLRRPPSLQGVKDAYVVYVVNDSMEPALPHGEAACVHPHRPARPGDNVVVQVHGEGGSTIVYVKTLVRRTETEIVCRQLNPPREFIFPRDRVLAIHKVLTVSDLISY